MSPPNWNSLADLPCRPKVLLIEDQPSVIRTVEDVLGTDCQVFIAADGLSAMALCTEKLPDLVLLDYEILGTSGLQAVGQLRAVETLQHIPVIFIASHPDRLFETFATDFAADRGNIDVVAKPVNPNVLHSRVTAHLLLKFHCQQLRSVIFRDGLTGVYNRSYFEEQIGAECLRAQRGGTVLSLLLIDIDGFNAYKEEFGQNAGDDALRLVARVLESQLRRPGDLVARYRGEEFVCLLPATDFEPAMQLAERIEKEIRARSLGHASASGASGITLSIGMATRRRSLDGGSDALLRLAGEQLEYAKQQGGARVSGKVLHRAADS
jgi:diguanylate cyclase (GGDEF)-like protein